MKKDIVDAGAKSKKVCYKSKLEKTTHASIFLYKKELVFAFKLFMR